MIEFILGVITIFILFLLILFGIVILAGAMIDYIYNDDIDEDGIDALLNSEEAIKTNKGVMYICEVNKRLERKLKHFRARKFDNELTCMKLIEV